MSARYVWPVIALCALALVPVSIHTYVGLTITDGFTTASLPTTVGAYTSEPAGAGQPWSEMFASDDWIERRFSGPGGTVMLTVLRTFDLKRAYHHPELALAHASGFTSHHVQVVDGSPLHVLRGGTLRRTAIYALHYDGALVAEPIRFQIRIAAEQLIGGRKPLTLVFARDVTPVDDRPVESWPSTQIVLGTVSAVNR